MCTFAGTIAAFAHDAFFGADPEGADAGTMTGVGMFPYACLTMSPWLAGTGGPGAAARVVAGSGCISAEAGSL